MNSYLIERLQRLNEGCGKLEVILRTLIAEEETATAHYLKYAHKVAEKAEEHQDPKGLKIAKVLEDIANEEKVHIGELQKCLDYLDVSNKEEKEGEKEAGEML